MSALTGISSQQCHGGGGAVRGDGRGGSPLGTPGRSLDSRARPCRTRTRHWSEALGEAGWHGAGPRRGLLPLAAPAGAALGRAFASLAPVDALLGGALKVGGAGALRDAGCRDGRAARGRSLARAAPSRSTTRAYTDALGVGGVTVSRPSARWQATRREVRMAAWVAASTGYLAGLSEEALGSRSSTRGRGGVRRAAVSARARPADARRRGHAGRRAHPAQRRLPRRSTRSPTRATRRSAPWRSACR